MARNYSKETAREKKKYGILHIKLDKQLVEEFRAKLQENGISLAEWMRRQIQEYLGD